MRGYIQWKRRDDRYGFIRGEDNNSYFYHKNDLLSNLELKEGDFVSFKGKKGNKGLYAVDVVKD